MRDPYAYTTKRNRFTVMFVRTRKTTQTDITENDSRLSEMNALIFQQQAGVDSIAIAF